MQVFKTEPTGLNSNPLARELQRTTVTPMYTSAFNGTQTRDVDSNQLAQLSCKTTCDSFASKTEKTVPSLRTTPPHWTRCAGENHSVHNSVTRSILLCSSFQSPGISQRFLCSCLCSQKRQLRSVFCRAVGAHSIGAGVCSRERLVSAERLVLCDILSFCFAELGSVAHILYMNFGNTVAPRTVLAHGVP